MNARLLEKLAKLADELDGIGSIKLANELDALMKEIMRRQEQEEADVEANLTFCPVCEGEGATEDEPYCRACRGTGFIALAEENAGLVKNAFIRKRNNKWCVFSEKGRRMGCYPSLKKAKHRLQQIEAFKHMK